MKLRITGTHAECTATVTALSGVLAVREISDFYPNRGSSLLGRVYIDADPPAGPVSARAERIDRTDRPAIPRDTGGEQR